MNFTGRQCCAGRALLGWSAETLAKAAGVGIATVRRFEVDETIRDTSKRALKVALEDAGLLFISAGERGALGGEGVRRA